MLKYKQSVSINVNVEIMIQSHVISLLFTFSSNITLDISSQIGNESDSLSIFLSLPNSTSPLHTTLSNESFTISCSDIASLLSSDDTSSDKSLRS